MKCFQYVSVLTAFHLGWKCCDIEKPTLNILEKQYWKVALKEKLISSYFHEKVKFEMKYFVSPNQNQTIQII